MSKICLNIVERVVIFAFFIFCTVLIIGCIQKTEIIEAQIIERDKNNNIIFRQGKNHDKSIKNELKFTLKDVNNLQEYIKNNFPSYTGSYTGDLSKWEIKEVIDDFNKNPSYCDIYINGIENMAGYSSVYSHFFIEGNKLYYFYFSIDEEYSDRSGIEYFNENIGNGSTDDSLVLFRNNYWEILWNDNASKYEKQKTLDDFLTKFFTTKVSKNIDIEWLKSIHTGIDKSQTVGDMAVFQSLVNAKQNQNFNNNRKNKSSGNRLANTTWEAYDDKRITISFGETGFSYTYLVWVGTWHTPDGWGEEKIAGSYSIEGDSITLKGNRNPVYESKSIEMTGALIGETLTISGIREGYKFHRIR